MEIVAETVRWRSYDDYTDFLESLSISISRVADTKFHFPDMRLVVDDLLVDCYTTLTKKRAKLVHDAIQQAPITEICLDGLSLQFTSSKRGQDKAERCEHLIRTLTALPTLNKAELRLVDRIFDEAHVLRCHANILRSLQHLTSVNISGYSNVPALVEVFRGNTTIREISLCMFASRYLMDFSVFHTMPALDIISFWVQPGGRSSWGFSVCNDSDAPPNPQAIARLLIAKPSIKRVSLGLLNFKDGDSHRFLCDGIARSKITSLDVHACQLSDPAMFALSVTNPNLKELRISNLHFSGCKTNFLIPLAEQLPFMVNLERFACEFEHWDSRRDESSPAFDAAMLDVAGALAECPNLIWMKLSAFDYSPAMDDALATCIRRCPQLSSLQVSHIMSFGYSEGAKYPEVVQALKTNYHVQQQVHLSPVLADTEKTIRILLSLNRAGRGYVATNAADKTKAVHVLGEVKDSLDCLFTHLGENPMICAPHDVALNAQAKGARGQKRKAATAPIQSPSRRLRCH